MSNLYSETELLIISKAKELIYREGKVKATSQEIADYSGVQRTLVNYYFRSKENLMRIAQEEVVTELHNGLNEIYGKKGVSFEEKVEQLIDFTFNFKRNYAFFEVLSINVSVNLIDKEIYIKPEPSSEMKEFMDEIHQEVKKGSIQTVDPIHFLINIFSLVSYPLVMKTIYKDVFGISESEFEDVLQQRKKVIKNLIFNK
ncbi:MAG: TetR/AcrR family transcriptional regulator [Crocinitomicaceae bacterium]|nr:TetR/AcrR family transcriptional regulator [Crocinitomicaceae bacterium]